MRPDGLAFNWYYYQYLSDLPTPDRTHDAVGYTSPRKDPWGPPSYGEWRLPAHLTNLKRLASIQTKNARRDNLRQARDKYKLDDNPAWNADREDIERAVSKLVGIPPEDL